MKRPGRRPTSGPAKRKAAAAKGGPAPADPKIDELRARAEALAASRRADLDKKSAGQVGELIHELQVHQIELEMQNDELRRAQVEIEESRSRFVDLYDFSPVGYLTLGRASVIREANLTAAHLLGIPRRDLVGRIFTQHIAPGHVDAFVEFKSRVLGGSRGRLLELEMLRPDKSRFWISLECLAVTVEGERAPCLRCSLSEITERRLQEEKVREKTAQLAEANTSLLAEMARHRDTEAERLRLSAAVEQAGEAVVIMDRDGFIHYVNPAFERKTGLSKESLVSRNYFDFLCGIGGDPALPDKARGLVRTGAGSSFHISRQADAGRAREFDITFSPIKDGAGSPISYLAVERDVTEQLQLDQYVRRSQKMEALGTLAGGVAHDFNNILTPIVINMELAQLELPEGSSLKSYVEMTLAAAQHGKELISQIIAFSRQKEPRRERLNLDDLVKETLELLATSLPGNITVRREIFRARGAIMADPGQVRQLIINLYNNAVYAMKESGGVLEVGLAPVEVSGCQALVATDLAPGPYLKLTVRDTGAGMAPEVMEKAFDPFFTTKKQGEGAGLGLAVVLSIVKGLGGAVTAESEPGRGSTFTIFLPRFKAAPARQVGQPTTLPAGRERVLIVEDEKVQAETLEKALYKLGYKAKALEGSLKALALFRQDPAAFDAVITDQSMPGMNGIDLAREILKIRPGLPVVLCTGYSEEVDADSARAAGIAGFIMKPYSIRDLATAIRQGLRERPKAAPVSRSG